MAVPAKQVYAAQPREGTETRSGRTTDDLLIPGFMQLNPARGRKLTPVDQTGRRLLRRGLCSSTPRGDGNILSEQWIHSPMLMVYAAQPREGTETKQTIDQIIISDRFMQLNPARGRKPGQRRVPFDN